MQRSEIMRITNALIDALDGLSMSEDDALFVDWVCNAVAWSLPFSAEAIDAEKAKEAART